MGMTNTQKEVKAIKKAESAPGRKQLLETVKTMVIVAFITAIIAFAAGVHYESTVSISKDNAVNSALKTALTSKN